jgi:thioredoxin reductase (NADPH)
MNTPRIMDLAVIGAGPCGLGVGTAAHAAGLQCVIFDKRSITSSLARYPTYMTFFSTAERLEIGGVPFIPEGEKPTRREALKYYRRVADEYQLDIRQYEGVTELVRKDDVFSLRTRKHDGREAQYIARNVAVATGYFDSANTLGVPGEDLPKVLHEYTEGHAFFRQECIIVGGGNSAVEAALELHKSGARVTIVHFLDTLDARVKPWLLPDITARLREGVIRAHWRSRLAGIQAGSVTLRSEETGELTTIPNDWVLAMTGYTPDPQMLRGVGVVIDSASGIPQHDPDSMQTNVPGVYVVGVIAAGYQANHVFIENGREHGPRIAASIVSRGTGHA